MKIVKKIKIKPNNIQKETIDFWIRRCLFLYNIALEEKIEYYKKTGKSLSLYEQKKELVDIKDYDSSWKDVPNKTLQEVIFRLDKSYKSFFKGGGFPKFKNKDTFNSIEFVEQDVRVKNGLVYLPKLKKGIKGVEVFPSEYKNVRLTKENGYYFLCFNIEVESIKKLKNNETVGCDLGLKTLLTDSNGFKVKRFNLKLIKKYSDRIDLLNKSLSNKKKGSKNRKKVKKQLNKTYLRLKNTRNDYLHKSSTLYLKQLKEDNIIIGDLTVRDLMKKDKSKKQKNFSKSYSNSSIKTFVNFLKYKSEKYNKTITIVGEQYTSKTCSCCGTVKYNLKISDRVYNCSFCGISLDRDVNGAVNIKKIGLNEFNPININIKKIKGKSNLLYNCSVQAVPLKDSSYL